MPVLPAPSVRAVIWDAWTSNYPSWVNKGLFCQANIYVQKCTVLSCNCLKYHRGMTVSYDTLEHRDSLTLSNYLSSAQTLPEAPLHLYCSHLHRTNTAVNRLDEKKVFSILKTQIAKLMLLLRALTQLCLFAGWKGDLHQPLAERQGIAVG